MVFNSIVFVIFLLIVFRLYWGWFARDVQRQNLLLIAAGFVFYGWWSWYFLIFLVFTSSLDYWAALKISQHSNKRSAQKAWLTISILSNLGVLAYFKYLNFFADSFSQAAEALGWHTGFVVTKIILPVGISFYTFQAMAYTIDVYRGIVPACKNYITYLASISFFPQLAAGPIERAKRMIPQFASERKFDAAKATEGLRIFLWGLIKKTVIADNAAKFVNLIYATQHPSSFDTTVAVFLFTVQIYADFSGYSDMARGLAKLLGFELSVNFRTPFFADGLKDFWQRWHISLSTWFRDYLYIPLGGNRSQTKLTWIVPGGLLLAAVSFSVFRIVTQQNIFPLLYTLLIVLVFVYEPLRKKQVQALATNFNLFLTFLVSGLWHGANWTFVFWGALHGTVLVLERAEIFRFRLPILIRRILTFLVVCFAFHFFRAADFKQAFAFFENIVQWNHLPSLLESCYSPRGVIYMFLLVLFFFIAEGLLSRDEGWKKLQRWPVAARWAFYYTGVLLVLLFAVTSNAPSFIYFQF